MKRTVLALMLIAISAIAIPVSAQRGRKPVNWKDLPEPFATPSSRNNPTVVAKPEGASLAAPETFEELAHVCRVAGGGPGLVRWLGHLKQQIGITGTLSSHGVKPGQIPQLVEIAVKDICHQTNPRPVTAADFERLFAEAM